MGALVISKLLLLWYMLVGLMIAVGLIMTGAAQMVDWYHHRQWHEFTVGAKQWQRVAAIPYADFINEYGKTRQVSPVLIAAVIQAESSFRSQAVSPAGAYGLMQIIPGTWEEVNRRSSICSGRHSGYCTTECYFQPELNIKIGTTYLGEMLALFQGDAVLAIAAYNAGPGAVRKHHKIPPYKETEKYVAVVIENWYTIGGKEKPMFNKAITCWESVVMVARTVLLLLIAGVFILAVKMRQRYHSWRWR